MVADILVFLRRKYNCTQQYSNYCGSAALCKDHLTDTSNTTTDLLRRFCTSKGKRDGSALWPMNLISECSDPYTCTLIKFIGRNAGGGGGGGGFALASAEMPLKSQPT